MSIILNRELTTPIVDWFENNIKAIKKNEEHFAAHTPNGHLGRAIIIMDIQGVEQRKKLLKKET